jgi:beta-glucosidase
VSSPSVPTSGSIEVGVEVTNSGSRDGVEVVQLYGRDVVASVTRPVAQLLAYRRVHLAPGETVTVELSVPTTRLAFSDRTMTRVVEAGEVVLWVGTSAQRDTAAATTLVGDTHVVTVDSPRWSGSAVLR